MADIRRDFASYLRRFAYDRARRPMGEAARSEISRERAARDQEGNVRRGSHRRALCFRRPRLSSARRSQACFAAGRSGEDLREHMNHGYEAARPSGWDPVERLKDQDLDGVSAEVLYSSLGIALLNMTDIELQHGVPARLQRLARGVLRAFSPSACSASGSIRCARLPDVSEIERCAKHGLKGS